MTEQEKAFWELWDKLEPLMQKFDTKPTLREMFDYGYSAAEERIIKLLEEHGVLQPARWEQDAELIARIQGREQVNNKQGENK